jgi:hypothetical protein
VTNAAETPRCDQELVAREALVRPDRSIDIDSWAENLPLEAIAASQDLLAQCREIGPSAGAWLVELEEG